jgi:putative peptidoglycan lipid II flippase
VAGAVLGTLAVLLGAVAAVAMLASPLIMRVLVAGVDDPAVRDAQQQLGVVFLLFFLPQVVFYGLGLVSTAVLNAESRFLPPAAAPIANNVVVMVTYAVFWWLRRDAGAWPDDPLSALEVAVLAGGTTLGVIAFTAVPVIAVRYRGFRLRARWGWRHPAVRHLARAGAWAAVTVGLTQVLTFTMLVLANAAAGGVVAFQFAFTFFLLPYALFAVPVATTLYPGFARAAQHGQDEVLARAVGRGFRAVTVLLVPCAAALFALAWPIARIAAFGEAGGDLTPLAHAIAALAPGLVGYGVIVVFTRASYALGDARLPAIVTGAFVAVGVAGMGAASWLAPLDERATALAAAHSVAYLLGAAALGILVRRRVGHSYGTGRSLVPVVGAGVVAGGVMMAFSLLEPQTRIDAVVVVAMAAVAGLAVYLGALRLLHGADLQTLVALDGDRA